MTVAVTVSASNIANAANFLQEYLTDQVPNGDFTEGTALRDLAVNAIAAVFAFLQADAAQIRQMQSLITVQAATGGDAEALADAVTGILSNVLIAPQDGTLARGPAIGHASQQVDVFIPTSIQFTYGPGIVFVVDNSDTLFIPAASLIPIVDTDGSILDYEFTIPLVAVATGLQYNVAPALFSGFDRFNAYVTRVENTTTFSGGDGPETVAAVIARAPTAIAVRNLINDRSIIATLNDNFDGINAILVVGMGDPEMQRDIVPTIAPNLLFHVGGCVDIYLRTALVQTTFTGAVGAMFARPDDVVTVFRDSLVNFSAVEAGDIIRITAGLASVPAEFLVVEIDGTDLIVSDTAPFPVATDEAQPPTTVTYVIGRIGPTYNDVISDVGGLPYTTGTTSRQVATSGRITLPGGPVMDILDVAILNPSGAESAFISTTDGFVHFPNQVDTTPEQTATPADGLQFQTIVHNPLLAQSASQWLEVVVGTDTDQSRFDGYQLRVTYRTLASFDDIDTFVRGTFERVSAAYQLPRGHHPVVVGMQIIYRLVATATTLLDNSAIAQTAVDYINAFDASSQSIDCSSIIQLIKDTYPTIANILPATVNGPLLTITYDLRAPTGDVIAYSTTDVVEIDPTKQVTGPVLDLDALGVTSRTMRYIANTIDVVAKQEGT